MFRNTLARIRVSLAGSEILLVALTAFVILELIVAKPFYRFPAYVDWTTIVTLTGLLLVTTAIKESNFFYWLAFRISKRLNDERQLALFLVFISALFAMLLTNDIALFIVVPLTLSLQKISGSDYIKFIVFEAIAVNVGSSLTPIGNPQNIFLWHQWQISFLSFIKEMAPMVGILVFWLLIAVLWVFPSKKIHPDLQKVQNVNRMRFGISAIFLIIFIISMELHYDLYFLPLLFVFYALFQRSVLKNAEWKLIALFIVIFIDVHLLYRLDVVNRLMESLQLQDNRSLFITGTVLSQIISNVPATLLLAKYSVSFKIMAYAVNVGGNGLLIASFANVIALHLARNNRKYRYFHRYSLLYLLVTGMSTFVFLVYF